MAMSEVSSGGLIGRSNVLGSSRRVGRGGGCGRLAAPRCRGSPGFADGVSRSAIRVSCLGAMTRGFSSRRTDRSA